ncbi:hypothetical protein F7731_26230 [Cytobacillus depressus]|uniref:Uncharacterized protein n=1 Tax=Cytobacillus depressus TaxID=1602942 RepID=A0A6L3UVW0_9BACI|nr:hypothetical protein [Cytobacillus depressus]KAB2327998.1 hypothetical protein F7731_26230 [Cytobacillus depressus]
MKYLFTVFKAVYTLFLILTIGMLVLAIDLFGRGGTIPFARYYSIIYLVVLLITILTMIINVVIAFSILIKKAGILKVVKRVGLFFIIGVVIAIIVSLIKNKIFFLWNIYFCLSLSPLLQLSLAIKKHRRI